MKPSTRRLQETIIRLLKGCLRAWETWLREQSVDGTDSTRVNESK